MINERGWPGLVYTGQHFGLLSEPPFTTSVTSFLLALQIANSGGHGAELYILSLPTS